ncbi:MAG: hypothetical protein SWO11_18940 [Thermodesulfobacteriota bacterium]|nr:hypothetical protein [Thermodesulfobacteriota bacterium]
MLDTVPSGLICQRRFKKPSLPEKNSAFSSALFEADVIKGRNRIKGGVKWQKWR